MNKFLIVELQRLKRQIADHISHIKKEMNNDPMSKILHIELEFQEFLKETHGKPGTRTTAQAMARIDNLYKERERHEERAKLWNRDDLINDLVEWQQAAQDLQSILWSAGVKQ